MTKIAFIFPGQGSQTVGMGVSVAEHYPAAKALYDQASTILGWDLLAACRQGPEDRLRKTDVAQPALFVTGLAAAAALREQGLEPAAVAGHSIGEYAALVTAGVFDFVTALRLVRERGRLMQVAAERHPGAMAAILGMDADALEMLCAAIQTTHGICVPVNFNSPEQIVVAGVQDAIDALIVEAPKSGAKRAIALNVAGAFHSPLMHAAAEEMSGNFNFDFQKPSMPVAMNMDGELYRSGTDIHLALEKQLDSPVQWVKSIDSLKKEGCTVFVECGAGRVLSGLLRRIDKQLQSYSTETAEVLAETREALSKTASPGT